MAIAFAASAASPTPAINRGGIVPHQPGEDQRLKPGMAVSIYGRGLGPSRGCAAHGASELCGTSVTVSGVRAEILYAQDLQLNVRIPYAIPTEGVLPFVVRYNGRSSAPSPQTFAPYRAAIRPPQRASTDMPIWVEIELPDPLTRSLRYPPRIRLDDFEGHHLELRFRGSAVPPRPTASGSAELRNGIGGVGGIGSLGPIGLPHQPRHPRRLPLHLLYRLDRPGTYEVRYVGYDFRHPIEKHVLARSRWIPLAVKRTAPGERDRWLAAMKQNPPVDEVEWLSDYLPGILAVADEKSLPFVEEGRRHPSDLVREASRYALRLFPEQPVNPARR